VLRRIVPRYPGIANKFSVTENAGFSPNAMVITGGYR